MKKILNTLLVLNLSIAAAHAATLYMGDGAASDISGAFSTGTADWNTGSSLWTPSLNPASYQTYDADSDAVILGDLPVITVTEDISVNKIIRETQVDANANRLDLFVDSNMTLTVNDSIDGMPYGTDGTARQLNINGPGAMGGIFTITNAARVVTQAGLVYAPGTEITFIGAAANDYRFNDDTAAADASNLTLILSGDPTIDLNKSFAATLGNVKGSGHLDLNADASVLILLNSEIGGAGSIGSLDQTEGSGGYVVLSNGTHTFEIDADAGTADLLTIDKELTFGGTLTVSNIAGTISSGDIYTLFSAASYTGTFDATNLPALTGVLEWDLSDLAVDGTIRVGGEIVDEYTGTLYLGDGASSYVNTPATWDSSSSLWGLGPVASESLFTNWIDGAAAVINGDGVNREVVLGTGLSATVNELVWDTTSGAVSFTGDGTQTLTITNEMRTALAQSARQFNLTDLTLAGQFDVQNVSRINIGGSTDAAPGTAINLLDVSDIQFAGTGTDFTDLSVTLESTDTWVYNKVSGNVVLGSLSGTGEIRMDADSPLTINNLMVGGISNSSSIAANENSLGDLVLGSGTHNFSINPSSGAADLLDVGPGTLTLGGDLIVGANNTNTFSLGQTFQLFDAAAITGSFSSVTLPESLLPAGTVWHNNLETDGSISVGTPGILYETINFTDFRTVNLTWPEDRVNPISGSLTNSSGTILTLELMVAGALSNNPSYVPWLYAPSIGGVSEGTGNARLDSFGSVGTTGLLDPSDDEALLFKLYIDGTPVDSLSFQSMDLDVFGTGEVAEFNDRSGNTNTLQDTDGSDTVSYDDALAGLTELTKDNVGSWSLQVTARAYESGGVTNDSIFSFDEIKFLVGYQFEGSFDIWTGDYGLEGDDALATADPDSDGVDNLSEFALNGNPTNSSIQGVFDTAAFEQGGTNVFEYIHVERKDGSVDYNYVLGENLQLGPWTTNSGIYEAGSGEYNEDYNIVTNHTAVDVDTKFIKLLIEQN